VALASVSSPEGDVDAANRGQDIGEDAVAARVAGNVVKQHGLVADPALIDVDDAANFALALGTRDVLQFAGRAQSRNPSAQILTVLRGGLFCCARFDGRIHSRNSRFDD
jgi:hypothetical protein